VIHVGRTAGYGARGSSDKHQRRVGSPLITKPAKEAFGIAVRCPSAPGFWSRLHEVDPGAVPGRGSDAAVASQKPRIERLRQRDVNRVVSREVVPQLPDPRQQHVVRITVQRKIGQSPEPRTAGRKGPAQNELSDFR
jgi:hypothetical protein